MSAQTAGSVTDAAASSQVTDRLARFASALEWEAVPEKVRELMPVLLIDVMRAGTVGFDKPWTRAVLDLYAGHSGAASASVLFSATRLDPARAAFVNGVACGSLDWDDAHVAAILHPGIVVWPAALAVAQTVGASGRQLLTAVVAGYEVAIRVGRSVQPEHSLRGFQGTPACGVFGAAAAAARLLELDAERTRDALGIAATFACGLAQFFISGSDIKRLHAGKAAANGVEAALLAHAGLSGPRDAIEGAQGFARAFSDRFDPAAALQGLGKEFPTLGISLKPHAGSVRTQAAIEAAGVLACAGATPESVRSMEVGVHGAMMGKLTGNAPDDAQQAQVSTPFAAAMAIALAAGRGAAFALSTDDYEGCIADARIRSLAARTTCVVDSQVEAETTRESVPGRVTCVLTDGTVREHFVRHPKGCPQNPLTADEVAARFTALAARRFAPADISRWLSSARASTSLATVGPLLALRAN